MEDYGKCFQVNWRGKHLDCIGPECRAWCKTIAEPIAELYNDADVDFESKKIPWPSDSLENCALSLIAIKGFALHEVLKDRRTGKKILEKIIRFY